VEELGLAAKVKGQSRGGRKGCRSTTVSVKNGRNMKAGGWEGKGRGFRTAPFLVHTGLIDDIQALLQVALKRLGGREYTL
jgi:hypothetical protein